MYEYRPIDSRGLPLGDDIALAASRRFLTRGAALEYARVMAIRYPFYRVDRVLFWRRSVHDG